MRRLILLLAVLALAPVQAQVPASTYVNFEARQTNPLRLSPNGKLLFAVNSADARLSVFNITATAPILANEIAVGLEPVSVNARTDDEVWVVNEVSDSISIVSVPRGLVIDTINVKDEPSDVVFARGLAFVSVAGNNELRVYNGTTRALVRIIPLTGQQPRALAVSVDGAKVFVAFSESGNRTTLIPAPQAPPQPSPTNSNLPRPPQVSLIVDATDPQWSPSVIKFVMPDNDVAEIDTQSLAVSRYFSRLGTTNLGIAVQPTTGDLFVTNTEARNLVRFEPNLRAHFAFNRVTRVPIAGGTAAAFDLNPSVDYSVLPNPAAQATALAQPTAIVFAPDGSAAYVAAFGSDRIAKMAPDGTVLERIELAPAGAGSRNMRGPRGLALQAASGKLYALNRISNTLSVVDTNSSRVLSELPVGSFDPTPTAIRNGRGFIYDARLSGNGTVSCASCHVDGNTDRLAWDLGDPGGAMQAVVAPISGTGTPVTFQMHPMKGPMTTQTLKGLKNLDPLHWRGDRANFSAFNGAFDSLLGGTQLSAADIEACRQYIDALAYPPNPNQRLDRTLPPTFAGGNPAAGRNTFLTEPYTANLTCNACHTVNPGPGTNRTVTPAAALQESQDFKVPQLRNMYQKTSLNDTPGATSLDGFGFTHDGMDSTLFKFLSRPVFVNFRNDTTRKTNLNAFMMCLDTGTAPAVGFTRTVTSANVANPSTASDWNLLQAQAAAGNIDLVLKGTIDGKRRGLLYQPASSNYRSDRTGIGPFTQTQLQAKISAGDTLSFSGVAPGTGLRIGIDRDLDGELDGDGPPFATFAQWRSYWFTATELANPVISGAEADPDRDGMANLLEYAFNSNPKQAKSANRPLVQNEAAGLSIIHTKVIDATDLEYTIEESTSLTSWTAAAGTSELLADDGRLQSVRLTLPPDGGPAKFLRVRATLH